MIDANFLLPHLKIKKWHRKNDRHLICPHCKVRTKLYKLSDGRKKCKRCDCKFILNKKKDEKRIKRLADCIVGFCLDFSARKTAGLFEYRYIDVWKIYMQLRFMLVRESALMNKLQGVVEADESYFGGTNRKRNKKYRKLHVSRGRGTDKTPVFGIRERKGNVQINLLSDLSEQTIERMITDRVKAGSTMMTDEFSSYKGLIYKGYIHRFVEHGKEQYARGNVHVNGMENFWSWTKEQMFKFHGVFKRNLFYYLKEMEWKFNHRHLNPQEKAITIAKIFNEKNN
jgi:transposase-like protein